MIDFLKTFNSIFTFYFRASSTVQARGAVDSLAVGYFKVGASVFFLTIVELCILKFSCSREVVDR